jgi:hypothetical protein
MFNIDESLVALLSSFGYDSKHHLRRTGEGWVYRLCNDNIGDSLTEVYKSQIVELYCHERVVQTLRALRAVEQNTDDLDLIEACQECQDFGGVHRKSLPLPDSDTTLITESDFKRISSSLTGVSKVFFHLCYYGNCKPEDLRDDSHELSKLDQGVISVVTDLQGSNRNRVITSTNRWGLSVEECQEVMNVLQDFTYSNFRDKSRNFNDYFQGVRGERWGDLQYYHLYTSHAFKMFNDGVELEEIAKQQGCVKISLTQRLNKYAIANEGNPLVQKYLDYRASKKRNK